MAVRRLRGYSSDKIVYRNERFTRGTVSSNDPLVEGSFRRLINFKVSNQNASLGNREPFLTVPLFDSTGKEVKLSEQAFVFSLLEDTQNSFIIDFNQTLKHKEVFKEKVLFRYPDQNHSYYVVDGDTISFNGQRYRLAVIDAPELEDKTFTSSSNDDNQTLGQEATEVLKKMLLNKSFRISQFDFQTELIDEFGRPLVYIILEDEEEPIVNFNLLKKGYAFIFNMFKFNNNLELDVPLYITLDDETDYAYSTGLKEAVESPKEFSPLSTKYFDKEILISEMNNKSIYTKPKVYKIKKETDLQKHQVEDKDIIAKFILETFDLNEVTTKLDLELFSDASLRYEIIEDTFSVTNSKYENQNINFFANVYDIYNRIVYTGLIEITRTSPNYEEGIFETFHIKTYKKPEMHVELQDVTNYKPNIADDLSIIPERLEGVKANVKGFTTPRVDAILLETQTDVNYYLKASDATIPRYFKFNTARFSDIDHFIIRPIFKAPVIFNKNNKYMYRWDIISNKEINLTSLKEVENANPVFRSAWTDLESGINISHHPEVLKHQALSLDNLKSAKEYYLIEVDQELVDYEPDNESFFEDQNLDLETTAINDYLENLEIDSSFNIPFPETIGDNINIKIRKTNKFNEIISAISSNKEDDEIRIDFKKEKAPKYLTNNDWSSLLRKIKNGETNAAFIFVPFKTEMYEEKINYEDGEEVNREETEGTRREVFYAKETKGFHLKYNDRKTILSVDLTFKELENIFKEDPAIIRQQEFIGFASMFNIPGIEIPELSQAQEEITRLKEVAFDEFFENGFTAVFYLQTYEDINKLTEDDSYYDQIAYKRSSATYIFKDSSGTYNFNDFVRERLEEESFMIKFSKYITTYRDHTIVYGNPMYNNTLFMSEPGSPYYFSLTSAFEFDHEIVHVQEFKDTLLVFTINDIWVIYEVEEKEDVPYQDEEGKTQFREVIKYSFRSKKVLYNISTEHRYKNSIHNLTRYITLLSNGVLYLIKPSAYIADDTQFSLTILSNNVDAIIKDPIMFINERLLYYGINELPLDTIPEFNMRANDNFIKIYYSVETENKVYTLVLTYDVLNNRWYEEDTITFGSPKQIYVLDATTGYEMLTKQNDSLYITYQTDKYNNLLRNQYGESYFDLKPIHNTNELLENEINYYIDTGYLKVNEHLRKRFRQLLLNIKNIDSKNINFTYNFTVDDVQFENNLLPTYTTTTDNTIVEIKESLKEKTVSNIGHLDNFLLDFSNLTSSDIMMLRHNLLGRGRIPRIRMGFTSKNRFYILSYGIVYSEKGGR